MNRLKRSYARLMGSIARWILDRHMRGVVIAMEGKASFSISAFNLNEQKSIELINAASDHVDGETEIINEAYDILYPFNPEAQHDTDIDV